MKKTTFIISKMDCPSEERLICLAFDGNSAVKELEFDLAERKLKVSHEGDPAPILAVLTSLDLCTSMAHSEELAKTEELALNGHRKSHTEEKRVLIQVFLINALMFLVDLVGGLLAQSTGLLADSLDMFADASVFALSIFVVGKPLLLKKRASRLSGYLQMILAIGAFCEVVRRFVVGSEPEAPLMIVIAVIAITANAYCMWLLTKHRNGEVHMRASWIFLSTDVIANAMVIFAGILVKASGSHLPDLIAGILIAAIVFWGSIRILRISSS